MAARYRASLDERNYRPDLLRWRPGISGSIFSKEAGVERELENPGRLCSLTSTLDSRPPLRSSGFGILPSVEERDEL